MPSEPEAVCFATTDYAGPARRFAAFLIDVVLMFVLLAGVASGVAYQVVPAEVRMMSKEDPEKQRLINQYYKPFQVPALGGWALAAVAYHVLTRKLRGGTIGYRLTGIRLVDQYGEPPAIRTLAKRLLVSPPFALPLGATYWACRKNARRQAVHDEICGTWVVRRKAKPAGLARIAYLTRLLGTFPLTYIDVEPIEQRPTTTVEHVPAGQPGGACASSHRS